MFSSKELCGFMIQSVTVWANSCIVCTTTEFNFIATVYRHTQYLYIPSVLSIKIMLTGLLF